MQFLSAKWIAIYIDILVLLIILGGFFWGIKRGLKKSVIRLIFIVLCAVIAFFTFPFLMDTLLDMKLSFITGGSINGWINDFVTSSLGNFAGSAEATITIIKTIVTLIIGSILFAILFFVLKLITWPIFALTARQKKDAKKHRWFGGLVGTVQGFLIAFLLFIPLGGISGIVDRAVVKNTQTENNPIAALIPESINPYLSVYENTVSSKVLGVFNLDTHAFNLLTTKKVNGQKVKVNDEVDNIIKLLNTAQKYDLYNLMEKHNNDYRYILEELIGDESTVVGQEPIRGLINDVSSFIFDSAITRTAIVDALNYVGKDVLTVSNYIDRQVPNIDWAGDKTIFSSAMSDLIISIKPLLFADTSTIDIKSLPLVEMGAALDGLRNMTLIKDVFAPFIVKTLEVTGGQVMLDELKITITESMINDTSLKVLCKAAQDTFTIMDKLQNNPGEIKPEDIEGIIDNLASIPAEVVDQMVTYAKTILEEQLPVDNNGQLIIPEGWDELTIDFTKVENQEAFKGAFEAVTIISKLRTTDEEPDVFPKLSLEDVASLVVSVEKISNIDASISVVATDLVNKYIENKFASVTLPEGTTLPSISDLKTTLEENKTILTLLLETGLTNDPTAAIDSARANSIIEAMENSSFVKETLSLPVLSSPNTTFEPFVNISDEEAIIFKEALSKSNASEATKNAFEYLFGSKVTNDTIV